MTLYSLILFLKIKCLRVANICILFYTKRKVPDDAPHMDRCYTAVIYILSSIGLNRVEIRL